MRYCCVPLCKSKKGMISFHEFPSDSTRRALWLKNLNRKDESGEDWLPSERSVVCGLHFADDAFKEGTKPKRLKINAAPTIFGDYPQLLKSKMEPACVTNQILSEHQVQFQNKRMKFDHPSALQTTCSTTAVHSQTTAIIIATVATCSTDAMCSATTAYSKPATSSATTVYPKPATSSATTTTYSKPATSAVTTVYSKPATSSATIAYSKLDTSSVNTTGSTNTISSENISSSTNVTSSAHTSSSIDRDADQIQWLLKLFDEERGVIKKLKHQVKSTEAKNKRLEIKVDKLETICNSRHLANKHFGKYYRILQKLEEDRQQKKLAAIFLLDQLNNYDKRKINCDELLLPYYSAWGTESPEGYQFLIDCNLFKIPHRSTINIR